MKHNYLVVSFVALAAIFQMYAPPAEQLLRPLVESENVFREPAGPSRVQEAERALVTEQAQRSSLSKATVQAAIPNGSIPDMVAQINSVFKGGLKLQDQANLAKAISDVNIAEGPTPHVEVLETLLTKLGEEYGVAKSADEILQEIKGSKVGSPLYNWIKLQASHVVNAVYSGGARVNIKDVRTAVQTQRDQRQRSRLSSLDSAVSSSSQSLSSADSSPGESVGFVPNPTSNLGSVPSKVASVAADTPVEVAPAPQVSVRKRAPVDPVREQVRLKDQLTYLQKQFAKPGSPAFKRELQAKIDEATASLKSLQAPRPVEAASAPVSRSVERPVVRKTALQEAQDELKAAQAVDVTRIPRGPIRDQAIRRVANAETRVATETSKAQADAEYNAKFDAESEANSKYLAQLQQAEAEEAAAQAQAKVAAETAARASREAEFRAGYAKVRQQTASSRWGDTSIPSSGSARPSARASAGTAPSGDAPEPQVSSGSLNDAYAALGVPADASYAEVRTAYIKLARQLHPDKTAGDLAKQEQFKKVSNAYEKLQGVLKPAA